MVEEKGEEAVAMKLWSEMMAEFSFTDAERILERMRA